MTYYLAPIFFLLGLAMVLGSLKRIRHRALLATFRTYNEQNRIEVVLDWIRERDSSARLTDVLDYLLKIEREDLAVEVLDAFSADDLRHRHVRVFACRAYAHQDRGEEAVAIAESLLGDYPRDDSILEIAIDQWLTFDELEKARTALDERLQRKTEGTAFKRLAARLFAAEGDTEKAIGMLQKIVDQDYALYKNTFAPAHRRLIYEQYVQSKTLLDQISGQTSEG